MAESHRQQRVAERIRKILSAELAKSNFSDKVLDKQPITITHVDPSPDLRHAKVFFTALGGVALVEPVNFSMLIVWVPLDIQLSGVNEGRIADELDRSFAARPLHPQFSARQGYFDFAVEFAGLATHCHSSAGTTAAGKGL